MAKERIINVQDQAKLSLQKVYSLVRSGIKHRLLRSSLTMSVILLAVAFFMVTLSENVIINAVANGVDAEVQKERSSIYLLNHLYNKPNSLTFSIKLSAAHRDPEQLKEIAAVTNSPLEDVTKLGEQSYWEQLYFRFFNNMSVGNRKMLIGNAQGRDIFQLLSVENNFNDFKKNLEPLRALKLPTEESEFKALIDNREQYLANLLALQKKWNEQIEALTIQTNTITNSKSLNLWLCEAKDSDMKQWQATVQGLHFNVEAKSFEKLQADMRKLRDRNEVTEALLSPELKSKWQSTFLVKEPLSEMIKRLRSEEVVPIINAYTVRTYTHEEFVAISESVEHNKYLSSLESSLSKRTEKQSGSILSGRQTFLLIISFVVCMVGIANAMLMAITERFREIATMKCLGATDSFILIQFMMEAAIQGVAGGMLGMAIGFLLGIIKTTFSYGMYPFYYFPMIALVVCAVISLVIGIILAILASLYPSWAASRMAPMEAMRIE